MPETTPWGTVQTVETVARGLRWVFTAGHGGVVVSPTRMAAMPAALRAVGDVGRRHSGRAGYGYYEEDCDWAAAALAFLDDFAAADRRGRAELETDARTLLADWHPDSYEAHFGVELGPGASRVKDERAFFAAHRDDHVAVAAVGNDDGTVTVTAERPRDGERRIYRVDRDEYRSCPLHHFVIDASRHPTVS